MEPEKTGEAFAPVFDRFSVRSYSDRPIPENVKNTILRFRIFPTSATSLIPRPMLPVTSKPASSA